MNAGFTQEAVAEKLCVTRQALSNWEQEKTIPDLYMFTQLAEFYGFSPDEFLLGKSYFKGAVYMKTNYSDAQVEKLICSIFPSITSLVSLSGGLISQTYSFCNNGEKYIFQVGGKTESYRKELYISKQYRDLLPIREMVDVRETSDGIAYCISRYIEGNKLFDLKDSERREIVDPVLDAITQMTRISIAPEKGYGRFDATGYARYTSWTDFVSVIYNKNVYDWSGLVQKDFDYTAIRKATDEIRENIDCVSIDNACFGHGDLGSYNIIVSDMRVTGFIDSHLAFYGDPLYDIANLLFWDEAKLSELVSAIEQFYLSDEKSKRKAYCYVLRIALEEIYNMTILNEVGYDIKWVWNRLEELLNNGLCRTALAV